MPVRVRVPAKVNVHLSVGAVRADGYHDISTVFQAVSLYDEVVAHAAEDMAIEIHGDGAELVPADLHNLAWQAALYLSEMAGVDAQVALELHKAIPVAGGMAGGSADAAAALLACATLWRTGTSRAELGEIAAQLGSDVAFPLRGGTALGTGRGEHLAPVLSQGSYDWVFALSDEQIAAGDAYRELDRLRASGSPPEPVGTADAALDAVRSGDSGRLADALANDLQPAALSLLPSIGDVLDAGDAAGALAGIVSGSGPTCAFLCAHADAAGEVAAALEEAQVCRKAVVATGPVPGARVVAA